MPRCLMLVALCVGLSGSFLLPPLTAVADERKPPEADVLANPGGGEKAKDYWTAERMRNAKPVRSPVLDPETLEPVKPE
ncbi:MAG: hypothetical protein GY798_16455 [Hyphomicrobiales bacterium]|nr:hypothetical protein [Hyphomicrobiales bacterium]